MEKIVQNLTKYLKDSLGISIQINKKEINAIPLYLRNKYSFFVLHIANKQFPIIIAKEELTPATIKKHVENLEKIVGNQAVFCSERITSYDRKRLIEYKVPFVIPNNQMYLPDLKVDLREHFRKLRKHKEYLNPSTQLFVLYLIYKNITDEVNPSMIKDDIGYSLMTISRIFDQLERFESIKIEARGKERYLKVISDGKKLWNDVSPYLRSPIKEKKYLFAINSKKNDMLFAGLHALSLSTMIASTEKTTYAISIEQFRSLIKQNEFEFVESEDRANCILEVWRYEPKTIVGNSSKTVDPLSLYLCFRNDQDVRIQEACEELLEFINCD